MHTRKVCSLALRPGHVAKRCRVRPAEERKNLLLESKVWVLGSTVTPPSSDSSESCRTRCWSFRAPWYCRGATKHHVTKLATAAEVVATAKRSHRSASMAHGRAKRLGQEWAAGVISGQHEAYSWGRRQQGCRGPRADQSACTTAAQSEWRGSRQRFQNLSRAPNTKWQGSPNSIARCKHRQPHRIEGRSGRNVGVGSVGCLQAFGLRLMVARLRSGTPRTWVTRKHRCCGLTTHHETAEHKRRSVRQKQVSRGPGSVHQAGPGRPTIVSRYRRRLLRGISTKPAHCKESTIGKNESREFTQAGQQTPGTVDRFARPGCPQDLHGFICRGPDRGSEGAARKSPRTRGPHDPPGDCKPIGLTATRRRKSRYPVLGPDGREAPGHCRSDAGTDVKGKLRLMP